mmetsp:Transcript_4319/g.27506  ORF Transcript_4319/g.27506 Transcript_4319/m.27506 type:complete len:215 (-) Transcript_4319:166-810(-)
MPGGILVLQQEQVRPQLFQRDSAGAGEPLLDLSHSAVKGESHRINLQAIACGEDGRFVDVRILAHFFDSSGPFLFRHGKFFAEFHGGIVDGEPDPDDAAFGLLGVSVGSSLRLELHQRFPAAWSGRGSVSIGVFGLGVRRLGQCGRVGSVSTGGLVLSVRTASRASTAHVRCRCHHSRGKLRHVVRSWRSRALPHTRTHAHTEVGGRSTNPTHQ